MCESQTQFTVSDSLGVSGKGFVWCRSYNDPIKVRSHWPGTHWSDNIQITNPFTPVFVTTVSSLLSVSQPLLCLTSLLGFVCSGLFLLDLTLRSCLLFLIVLWLFVHLSGLDFGLQFHFVFKPFCNVDLFSSSESQNVILIQLNLSLPWQLALFFSDLLYCM